MSACHPNKQNLIAFGQGLLDADESLVVEQHLQSCSTCCETLLDLKDDTFVGLVRAAKPRMAETESDAAAESANGTASQSRGSNDDSFAPTMVEFQSETIRRDTTELPECPAELQEHPRYRIVAPVGRGGMGSVYRAEHRLMQRSAAIKVINPELVRHPQAVERFRREVQAAAKLSHPNIVAAWDAEKAGDLHLLVMEFVDGTDLATIVQQQGQLDVTQACRYITQAALGLQHAYEKGMVHRDIKPHNLMLTPDGRVRILDFGLAGIVSHDDVTTIADTAELPSSASSPGHLTSIGSVMGTPDYMAPEQAVDAHSADIRADIYALGCTLYYLLTGKPPFEAEGVVAKLKAHTQTEPTPLSTLRKDVPAELCRVAARMLAKNPVERFQSPAEVVAALEPWIDAGRQKPRFRAAVAAAVFGFLALLAGIIVVATDHGRLEIRSEVGDVRVVVRKGGQQIEVFDLKTGSLMKWVPGGEYELEVVGNSNDVTLDRTGFTMSRLGKVIVTAEWNKSGTAVLKSFSTSDKPVTQEGVTVDDGGWRITATHARTVPLFEIAHPTLETGPFFFRAKLRTDNVTGRAYLEMQNTFPGKGEFFSKGLDNSVVGTTGWTEYEIPFYLKPGDPSPDLVRFFVTIEGAGTVWIKDPELRGPSPIQGKWLANGAMMGGQGVPKDQLNYFRFEFDGEKATIPSGIPNRPLVTRFRVDISNDPWRIDFLDPKRNIQTPLTHGIVKIDGDRLQMTLADGHQERPAAWAVLPAPPSLMVVMLRRASATDSAGLQSDQPPNGYGRDGSTKLEAMSNADTESMANYGISGNLITDPSFENTALTQLPSGWRVWLNDGPDFRCEVVAGGHTGQRCLQISGKGTRGVVFANDIKVDRTKRYALKGWAKCEGDNAARAIVKFNYFRGNEFLGAHDLVGAMADQPGWNLFEKTDALDAYPTADHFYAMCHVEGSGTGWFDDLELVAHDLDTLPKDFDARHGRHNRLHGPNSLHRWVGSWDTEYVFRETDNSPTETRLAMITVNERTLGDYFLMSHAKKQPQASGAAFAPRSGGDEIGELTPPRSPAIDSDERLLFLTFDQNLGAFRQWIFSSNGKAFEWRGPWNNEKQTLELRMLPDASNLHSSEHFVDDDHIEAKLHLQYVMGQRDAGRWTATRTAFDGKVDIPSAKTHVAEPAELSQLNKFVGEWSLQATYKPSIWNPQPREETATESSQWILGGRFVMTRAFNEKRELTSIWIATYEPMEQSNRFWFFNADGTSGEWRLTWDHPSNGFQFRAVDLPDGWSGTGFNRWVDADSFHNQALIKDEKDRVLLDMIQIKRRQK